jgi:hypothetical protein
MGRLVLGLVVAAVGTAALFGGASGKAAGEKLPITAAQARAGLKTMQFAIVLERQAIAKIGTLDVTASDLLQSAERRLATERHALNPLAIPGPSPVPYIAAADQLDEEAVNELDKKTPAGEKAALGYVADVLRDKKLAADRLESIASGAPGKRCDVTKQFSVYAVPAGYTASTNDVFPHGIPPHAQHIKVSFIDLATGKPPTPDVFPGQTWSVQVKGFRPDGKFDVRVNVSGTGFGSPDANSKRWEVVVSYDCP